MREIGDRNGIVLFVVLNDLRDPAFFGYKPCLPAGGSTKKYKVHKDKGIFPRTCRTTHRATVPFRWPKVFLLI